MASKYAFAPTLRELRFLFCQTGEPSASTRYSPLPSLPERSISVVDSDEKRSFLTRAYPTMKKANPHTPILIRGALGVGPRVWARHEHGREEVQDLSGLSDKEIEERVAGLVRGS
ncbi:MAG: hypothetical protein M1832_002480 [Thelocarpon impressellum]|nr:MAG: hypothetical protein M1832_002480 [Thelocarpon impressellum]